MRNSRLSRRIFWIALVAMALSVFTFHAAGRQPDGAYDWVMTPEALIRTAAGECYVEGAQLQEVCVEWCVLTHEGEAVPQGQFDCRLGF